MTKSTYSFLLFLSIANISFAQTFDWGPMQMEAKEVMKFKIKQVKATMKKAGEKDKSYYYDFDRKGHISTIADTAGQNGSVSHYTTKFDEEGRIARKVKVEENIMTVELEKNTYKDGKLHQRLNELFYPMQYAVFTDYIYTEDRLMEERITFEQNVLSRSFYFYGNSQQPDSIHHYSFNRTDSLLEHRTYFQYAEAGKRTSKLIRYITRDTIEYEVYDAMSKVIYHQELSNETDLDKANFFYGRRTYTYKGDQLMEERFINDTYLDKSGKKEVFISKYIYDDKNKLQKISRPGYESNMVYEASKEGEIRYSLSNSDTTEVLITSMVKGLKKEVSISKPGVPLESTLMTTTKWYDKDGEVVLKTKVISGKTERCETTYSYTENKEVESEKCQQLGEQVEPPFSIERSSVYYDAAGNVVKEVRESKRLNDRGEAKPLFEKAFTYDDKGRISVESNKNLEKKDARVEFVTYTYNAEGQLSSLKRFQGEIGEGMEYAEENYEYEKGKLKRQIFTPKTPQMSYMFPPKQTIYLPNGKTERIITFDQQGKEAILLNLTYNKKGLCLNQRITEYGKVKVSLEYEYELY